VGTLPGRNARNLLQSLRFDDGDRTASIVGNQQTGRAAAAWPGCPVRRPEQRLVSLSLGRLLADRLGIAAVYLLGGALLALAGALGLALLGGLPLDGLRHAKPERQGDKVVQRAPDARRPQGE
jgi:hypothetical protein